MGPRCCRQEDTLIPTEPPLPRLRPESPAPTNPTRGTLSQVSYVRSTGYLHGGEPERPSGDNMQCPRTRAVSGETCRDPWAHEEPGPSSPFPPLPPPPRTWPQAVRPRTCTHSLSTKWHLGTGRAARGATSPGDGEAARSIRFPVPALRGPGCRAEACVHVGSRWRPAALTLLLAQLHFFLKLWLSASQILLPTFTHNTRDARLDE